MKIIYTIVFFLSVLLLIFFMYDLLRIIGKNNKVLIEVVLILGVVLSIALLAFSLFGFLKIPPTEKHT